MTRPDEDRAPALDAVHVASSHALMILNQVFDTDGGVIARVARGELDNRLSTSTALDLADLTTAFAEHARYLREMTGLLGWGNEPPIHTWSPPHTVLPLNRQERYYTGTVLPMLVGGDGFTHLHRFLRRCGLHVGTFGDRGRLGAQALQFFTEYSLAKSIFTDADRTHFPHPPTSNDTPDIVLAGPDWLLVVEAKMFHNPTPVALNAQYRRQRVIVDYIARTLKIPDARVRHVFLLPAHLTATGLDARVITWEQVLDDYRIVGPAYWVGILDAALTRYDDLVSRGPVVGQNKDDDMTGTEIVTAHADGTLEFTYISRNLGLHGADLAKDISSGQWRTQRYEVRTEALDPPNWFPINKFIELTASN